MRIPNSRDRDDQRDERSMTAMIDVVFLLLIFFVCASIGRMGELLISEEMSGGSIQAAELKENPNLLGEVWVSMWNEDGDVVVRINAGGDQGASVFRGQSANLKTAKDLPKLVAHFRKLASIESGIPVIFDTKPGVFMADHFVVRTAATTAGFTEIKLAMEPPPKKP